MQRSLKAKPILSLLLPLTAILAGRIATHSALAERHPHAAALLFAWLVADALALALIARSPGFRSGLRPLLGAIAAGFALSILAAAPAVREALFAMEHVVAAFALTIGAYLFWSAGEAMRRYRAGQGAAAAWGAILPERLVGFIGRELAMVWLAIAGWGRAPDIPDGAQGFAYHRHLTPVLVSFMVLQAIEIVVVDLLVSHWSETAALVLLALGLWGMLFLVALTRAMRIYPVLIDEQGLRIRGAMLVDVRVPLATIQRVGKAISHAELQRPEVLNAALLAHPNIVLSFAAPMARCDWLGRMRRIDRVAFRLDDPQAFLAALEASRGGGDQPIG